MLPILYLRSSSYGSHEMCEMKYFGEYVLGWTGLSNKKADKGTIVHKCLEVLATIKLAIQNSETKIVDDIVGTIDIGTEHLNEENSLLDLIMSKVYKHYAEANSHHSWTDADYRECYRWLMKAIEYNNGQFNPLNQDIVIPESHFNIEVKADWAKIGDDQLRLKGTIDLIVKADEDTNEIIDFKTGKRLNWATGQEKTYEALHKDFQLRLYHYAHLAMYPKVKNVLVTIFYINDGGAFTLCFDRSDVTETLSMIRDKFEAIRDTEKPKPNYTWKCKKFCDFGKKTFADTHINPIMSNSQSVLSNPGEHMCKCDQIVYSLQYRPLDIVIDNMSKKNHDMSHYKEPGSTTQ